MAFGSRVGHPGEGIAVADHRGARPQLLTDVEFLGATRLAKKTCLAKEKVGEKILKSCVCCFKIQL